MVPVIDFQISVVLCSKMRASLSERYVVVAIVDSATMLPSSSSRAALAEPVPLHQRVQSQLLGPRAAWKIDIHVDSNVVAFFTHFRDWREKRRVQEGVYHARGSLLLPRSVELVCWALMTSSSLASGGAIIFFHRLVRSALHMLAKSFSGDCQTARSALIRVSPQSQSGSRLCFFSQVRREFLNHLKSTNRA